MAASSKLRWLPWTGPLPAIRLLSSSSCCRSRSSTRCCTSFVARESYDPELGRGSYTCARRKGRRRQQKLMRNERQALQDVAASLVPEVLPEELRAAIVLFFSLLDERQRRLFAGLEATKLGHGGDRKIADLLDLDPHTVAKGRRELFGGSVERGRVRRAGGGNQRVEKKRPR